MPCGRCHVGPLVPFQTGLRCDRNCGPGPGLLFLGRHNKVFDAAR